MEFYDRMKELQISQQDNSRMRGARLQAMWNRICEDELKSLVRNQELIHEFERVESHVKRLSARTEKLQQSRQQYMDYITKHYPQWSAKKQHLQQIQQATESPVTPTPKVVVQPATPQHDAPDHITHFPDTNASAEVPDEQGAINTKPSVASRLSSQVTSAFTPPVGQKSVKIEEIQAPTVLAQAAALPSMTAPHPTNSALRDVGVHRDEVEPVSFSLPDHMDEVEGVLVEEPVHVERTVQRFRSEPQGQRRPGLNSPTIHRLAVRDGDEEVLIPTLQLGSTDGTGVTVGTGTLSDQMSELLGSVHSSQTPRLPDSLTGAQEFTEQVVEIQQTETEEEVQDSNLEPLNLDGFCLVLKTVAEDFSVSFNPEAFYRCETMDKTTRKKLVYCANSGDNLDHFDPNTMSMVILEELPGVSRSLPGKCMVRDEVLEDISFMVKEIVFRAKLTTDGRQLWDALYDHMRQAIVHGVLSPREIALMIGPSLLRPKSPSREKIVTVLTSLLQTQNDSQMSDVSSATSINTSPSKMSLNQYQGSPSKLSLNSGSPSKVTTNPPIQPGGMTSSMNPVSPRDRSTSDDDFYDKSTPRYKPDFTLTGSAAYKSMMGGSHHTQTLDDDDDDVEDMIALPRGPVVIPTNQRGDDNDNDVSVASAPSPVSMDDKLMEAPHLQLASSAHGGVMHGTVQSTGSSAPLKSSGSQPGNVIQRLMSESEFSDTEVSLPMAATGERKNEMSEVDDFEGFFD